MVSPTEEVKKENRDLNKADDGEYKFNLGLYRIEDMNDIIKACIRQYYKAWTKRDERHVRKYQGLVNTLYSEAYIYMRDDTEFEFEIIETENKNKHEVLRQVLDKEPDYDDDDAVKEHLQQLRSIYLGVRELIKEIGMDIPKEQKIGETDIFSQG